MAAPLPVRCCVSVIVQPLMAIVSNANMNRALLCAADVVGFESLVCMSILPPLLHPLGHTQSMSRFLDRRKEVGDGTRPDRPPSTPAGWASGGAANGPQVSSRPNSRALRKHAAATLRKINVPAILALGHLRYCRHCPDLICLSEEMT